MNLALTLFAGLSLFAALILAIEIWNGNRSMPRVHQQPPSEDRLPRVSVIIPARNEENTVQAALRSVLSLDYPSIEVIVLNDRSTDGTPAKLRELQFEYPALRIINIETLPEGWLGKNHALWFGARNASGEYLLFTDADVVYEPSTLKRAVTYAQQNRLDFLTMMPRLVMPTLLLDWFVGCFLVFFVAYFRPWRMRRPDRSEFIGVGAFTLVRKGAYEAAGTHEAIRLRPDDDLMLGKLFKQTRMRTDVMIGSGGLSIRWYASLREAIDGLMKNAFSGLGYRWHRLLLATAAILAFNVWPFIAVFSTSGACRWINLAITGVILIICADNARFNGLKRSCGLAYPAMSLLLAYVMWRSAILATLRGGIIWRGTFYSLRDLKTAEDPSKAKCLRT